MPHSQPILQSSLLCIRKRRAGDLSEVDGPHGLVLHDATRTPQFLNPSTPHQHVLECENTRVGQADRLLSTAPSPHELMRVGKQPALIPSSDRAGPRLEQRLLRSNCRFQRISHGKLRDTGITLKEIGNDTKEAKPSPAGAPA